MSGGVSDSSKALLHPVASLRDFAGPGLHSPCTGQHMLASRTFDTFNGFG